MGKNQPVDGTLLDAFSALKDNILRSTNVADVGIVESVDGNRISCRILSNPKFKVRALLCDGLTVAFGDAVVILYIDYPFANNFLGSSDFDNTDTIPHQKANGVAIAKLS